MDAGPVVRTNQLDFDDEVIYKASQYLYDHIRHRTEQPFCLTVSMTHPHDPYSMTKEYWDLYEDVEIPLPKNPGAAHEQQDPHSQRVLKCIDLYGKGLPAERIRAARRAYYAACSYVDDQVGKLLRILENCGMSEDTIVVFAGDHGDMLGERGLWYKMVWYENSARVPFIVHAPRRFSAKRVSENVSTMDILPTFADLVGAPLIPGLPLDGVSLMPHLTGGPGVKTDTVFGEYMGEGTQMSPVMMIRRGRYKFTYSLIDPPMLFDVVADPEEKVDLAVKALPLLEKASSSSAPSVKTATTIYLPSPDKTPPTSTSAIKNGFFPTPPRTPSPSEDNSDNNNKIVQLLASFLQEARARWDMDRIKDDVLRSQRRRRLVYSALIKGVPSIWDYEPRIDPSTQYVRNQAKGALDDVEIISRWPRVLQQAANKLGNNI